MYRRKDLLYEQVVIINGKRKAFRGKTEKIVTKKILEYKGEIEKGRLFKVVAEEWKEEHFKELAYNSTKNYTPAYNRVIDKFGERYIKEIKPAEIQAFINKFAKTKALKTVRTQLLVTNLIFSKAMLDSDIESNPAAYVKVPKNLAKTRRELPSDEDINKVKNGVNQPFGLFAYFILYSGLRRGEALALQYKDIDFKNKVIKVTKSVYHVSDKPYIKEPKTEAGKREVILIDKLAKKIPKLEKEQYLFENVDGGILTQKRFSTLWKNYCKAVGVDITPHQLRHAYATILFEAGLDVKDAQEQLGHASAEMTQDIYTHIRESRKKETANKLNAYV